MKHKRGKLFADLTHPGDEVVVARGGQGGVRHNAFYMLAKKFRNYHLVVYFSLLIHVVVLVSCFSFLVFVLNKQQIFLQNVFNV